MADSTVTVNGVDRKIDSIAVTVNGVWREVDRADATVSGVWREGISSFKPFIWYAFVESTSTSYQTAWSVDADRIAKALAKGYNYIDCTDMGQMYESQGGYMGVVVEVTDASDHIETYSLYEKTAYLIPLNTGDKKVECKYLSINGNLAGWYGRFEFSQT